MKKAMVMAGLVLLIFSILAQQLGIDNDDGWGIGRIMILAVGLALITTGLMAFRYPEQFSKTIAKISARKHLLLAVLLVTVIYTWVSQVNAECLRNDYHYYGELASSFKNGQLYLDDQPSQALLALSDPYDYDLRVQANVEDFPWDVSLYKQKFYLYYGPLPALVLSFLSNELLSQIGDRHLVIAFAFGLFFYETLILLTFFARSLPKVPGWLVGLCVLTVGLTAPTPIVLQESRLYQVAVLGAQFFFVGGCYWIYSAITQEQINLWKIGFAAIHWALALGTRISIAPMILYAMAVAIIYMAILHKTSVREILHPIIIIGIPLCIAAASLAWYNWARFDSIFEFGLQYTLTDINYPKARDIFSVKHIGTNLYNYFVHPLRLSSHFPYLIRIEYRISNERLGGLLYVAPYILFALLPVVYGVRSMLTRKKLPSPCTARIDPEFWMLVTFAGSAIIGAITILSFWTVQLRYTDDFMPSLLLFATANVAKAYGVLEHRIKWQKLFVMVTVLFASITVIASALIAFKSDSMLFWVNLADTILRILNLK